MSVEVLDLTQLPLADRWASQHQLADRVQASLDLAHGPVLGAGAFIEPDGGARVLLAVHHLCIDTLSWPILLADLALAYTGATLPPASGTSFARWAAAIAADPRPSLDSDPLPATAGQVKDTDRYQLCLDEQATAALLAIPGEHRLRVEDLLVTALAITSTEAFGPEVTIDVERHGREHEHADLDVSETIGWFTSVFPLRVHPVADPLQALLTVKQQLRQLTGPGSVRQGGQLVFNYHGRQQVAESSSGPFRQLEHSLGSEKSARQQRTHLLELEAAVHDGRLRVEWLYSGRALAAARVHALAARYLDVVRLLVDEVGTAAGVSTPDDFPLVALSQSELSELELSVAGSIDDLYPLSAMQSAMVMHTMLEPEAAVYFEQQHYRLVGEVDEAAFSRAWQQLTRHPALRSVVSWELEAGPVQVVLKSAGLEHRTLPPQPEQALAAELVEGFELTDRPPVRVWTARRSARELAVVFSFHHVLLDGWSVGVLLSELMRRYQAELAGAPLPAATDLGPRRFQLWQARQQNSAAAGFWKSQLDGAKIGSELASVATAEGTSGVVDLTVADAVHSRLRTALAGSGSTLSTLAHAAWAALLSIDSGSEDIVLGSVVSGRSNSFDGIDEVVGMLMNTLPLRVELDRAMPVASWLARLQQQHAELREHEHSSLIDIAEWAGLPGRVGLFQTIVAVENIRHAGQQFGDTRLEAVSSRDRTGYPLTLLVYDDEQLAIRLAYEGSYCDRAHAQRLAQRFVEVLVALAGAGSRQLGGTLAEVVRESKVSR